MFFDGLVQDGRPFLREDFPAPAPATALFFHSTNQPLFCCVHSALRVRLRVHCCGSTALMFTPQVFWARTQFFHMPLERYLKSP